MMRIFILITTLYGICIAAPAPQCHSGSWSEWGRCKSGRGCSSTRGESWDVAPAEWDTGRLKMRKMMHMKEDSWKERAECTAAGTCPELAFDHSSGGFMPCSNGYSDANECRNVDRLSFVSIADLGYVNNAPGENVKEANDIWGWTDPATRDEYAIIGLTGGTSFVRVTDPENPVTVGFLYTQTRASLWRDIKVIGNYAYIVAEAADHGLQIFDLTQLRGRNTIRYFDPTHHYDRIGNAHNIIANEDTDFVYVVGATRGSGYDLCRGGLHIVDVKDPLNPRFVTCFGDDGYVHDAQCTHYHGPDTRYQGHEICLCFNENTFTIVDVEDKKDLRIIASRGYTGYQYTHQGWFTEDHTVVLLDDELDEQRHWTNKRTRTYVWDVRRLDDPTLQRTYYSSENSIDHNLYILGDLAFQANYQAGFRLLAIDQANYDLTEVAYFDTYPPDTSARFNGAWSSYPYFASRNVVVSNIEDGLYVLRPDYAAIDAAIRESAALRGEQRRYRRYGETQSPAVCPAAAQSRQCDVTAEPHCE